MGRDCSIQPITTHYRRRELNAKQIVCQEQQVKKAEWLASSTSSKSYIVEMVE